LLVRARPAGKGQARATGGKQGPKGPGPHENIGRPAGPRANSAQAKARAPLEANGPVGGGAEGL